jgi:hypothetical protein
MGSHFCSCAAGSLTGRVSARCAVVVSDGRLSDVLQLVFLAQCSELVSVAVARVYPAGLEIRNLGTREVVEGNGRSWCILWLAICLAWLVMRHCEARGRGCRALCGYRSNEKRAKEREGKQKIGIWRSGVNGGRSADRATACQAAAACREQLNVAWLCEKNKSHGKPRSCNVHGKATTQGPRRCVN